MAVYVGHQIRTEAVLIMRGDEEGDSTGYEERGFCPLDLIESGTAIWRYLWLCGVDDLDPQDVRQRVLTAQCVPQDQYA